jgi:signal transduction histidine kinase
MFRRLHPGAEYEGTGIGLALCKKIVEKHNGFISAKSALNEGSVFTLSLPVEHPLFLVGIGEIIYYSVSDSIFEN